MQSESVTIQKTTSQLSLANSWDHLLARWAINRSGHRVAAGLYALGSPSPEARVFVTANYSLSFDALRSNLAGMDAYILVLDTDGVNVWCAAGKGSFGTDELVRRIEATGLKDVVSHRELILPQLGAPGVAAHEVRKRSGFKVTYGPVRAADLPAYLQTGQATPEMRRVRFNLRDRITLIPVELVFVLIPLLIVALVLRSLPAVVALLAGTVLFPILLPWLPTPNFTTKGFILGVLVMIPFVLRTLLTHPEAAWWIQAGNIAIYLLVFPPVTAYLALNFTGSTSFTSRTGVRKEIYAYIPALVWSFGIGVALNLLFFFVKG